MAGILTPAVNLRERDDVFHRQNGELGFPDTNRGSDTDCIEGDGADRYDDNEDRGDASDNGNCTDSQETESKDVNINRTPGNDDGNSESVEDNRGAITIWNSNGVDDHASSIDDQHNTGHARSGADRNGGGFLDGPHRHHQNRPHDRRRRRRLRDVSLSSLFSSFSPFTSFRCDAIISRIPTAQCTSPQNEIEEATCPICLDLWDNPIITPCGHIGCRRCMTTAVEKLRCCPVCKQSSRGRDLERLRGERRKRYDELTMKCSICNERMKLKNYRHHLSVECHRVRCCFSLFGCQELLSRPEQRDHESRCPFRLCKCPCCLKMFPLEQGYYLRQIKTAIHEQSESSSSLSSSTSSTSSPSSVSSSSVSSSSPSSSSPSSSSSSSSSPSSSSPSSSSPSSSSPSSSSPSSSSTLSSSRSSSTSSSSASSSSSSSSSSFPSLQPSSSLPSSKSSLLSQPMSSSPSSAVSSLALPSPLSSSSPFSLEPPQQSFDTVEKEGQTHFLLKGINDQDTVENVGENFAASCVRENDEKMKNTYGMSIISSDARHNEPVISSRASDDVSGGNSGACADNVEALECDNTTSSEGSEPIVVSETRHFNNDVVHCLNDSMKHIDDQDTSSDCRSDSTNKCIGSDADARDSSAGKNSNDNHYEQTCDNNNVRDDHRNNNSDGNNGNGNHGASGDNNDSGDDDNSDNGIVDGGNNISGNTVVGPISLYRCLMNPLTTALTRATHLLSSSPSNAVIANNNGVTFSIIQNADATDGYGDNDFSHNHNRNHCVGNTDIDRRAMTSNAINSTSTMNGNNTSATLTFAISNAQTVGIAGGGANFSFNAIGDGIFSGHRYGVAPTIRRRGQFQIDDVLNSEDEILDLLNDEGDEDSDDEDREYDSDDDEDAATYRSTFMGRRQRRNGADNESGGEDTDTDDEEDDDIELMTTALHQANEAFDLEMQISHEIEFGGIRERGVVRRGPFADGDFRNAHRVDAYGGDRVHFINSSVPPSSNSSSYAMQRYQYYPWNRSSVSSSSSPYDWIAVCSTSCAVKQPEKLRRTLEDALTNLNEALSLLGQSYARQSMY